MVCKMTTFHYLQKKVFIVIHIMIFLNLDFDIFPPYNNNDTKDIKRQRKTKLKLNNLLFSNNKNSTKT